MFEECGRKALTDQKEKQMSDIRSKDMDQHNRVCAQIDLDAIAYNMEQMKDQIGKEARLIAVIKTDGYGHGAVPIARMFETFSYVCLHKRDGGRDVRRSGSPGEKCLFPH